MSLDLQVVLVFPTVSSGKLRLEEVRPSPEDRASSILPRCPQRSDHAGEAFKRSFLACSAICGKIERQAYQDLGGQAVSTYQRRQSAGRKRLAHPTTRPGTRKPGSKRLSPTRTARKRRSAGLNLGPHWDRRFAALHIEPKPLVLDEHDGFGTIEWAVK